MAISKRGNYENPTKSPYSFEKYDSILERKMMSRLEEDAEVVKWMKRHDISIPWIDVNGRKHNYRPDFLVQYRDGTIKIIEVKDPTRIESDTVQRKRTAAEAWCRKRNITYELSTIDPD